MKRILILSLVVTLAGPAAADEVTDLFRKAYKQYTAGELGEMTATLREITRLTDDRKELHLAKALPNRVGEYLGLPAKSEDPLPFGGGVSLERSYVHGPKMITVKVVQDSPLADAVMKLLTNDDLVAWSGVKVHTIDGQQAIMDGERRLRIAVEGRTYLEVTGNAAVRESEVVSFTRKLPVRELR